MDLGLGNVLNPLQGMADLTGYSANKLNQQQFREQMNFSRYQFDKQVEMANSAHQREMADLKKSGLNPVLTAMGGQGANSAQGVSMPHIPDNAATQKGQMAILNSIMSIMPQIAQMKTANAALKQGNAAETLASAQSKKLVAEAGKLGTEKDINEFLKQMKKYEWEHYGDKFSAEISKSPWWMVEKLKEMFNTGTNSAFAKGIENSTYDLLKDFEKIGGAKNNQEFTNAKKRGDINQKFGMLIIKLVMSLI